ncbi:hypothetical protein SD51_12150 [Alicyclobacillus tengchongensis]|nr:hypothetical protein SD51_12150 [Alicyclobacillus tengchongensis]
MSGLHVQSDLGLAVLGQAAERVTELLFEVEEQKRERARLRRALHAIAEAETLAEAKQIANRTLATEKRRSS